MATSHKQLQIQTKGRGFYELSAQLQSFVHSSTVASGLLHVFVPHTSASLILCENADPDVRSDLEAFMSRLVLDGDPSFAHSAEGPDDMPAHIRSVLTQNAVAIPIQNQTLQLGTWQGLYLWEHRHHPHKRNVVLTVLS